MLTRRNFVASAASIAAAGFIPDNSRVIHAMPKATSELGKVKILDVKTTSVKINYDAHLVKITTDSGLYGLGEAYAREGVLDYLHSIKGRIIGEDPLQVDYLFHRLMAAGEAQENLGAVSGIETALWDLAGKILNVPVYTLLGGKFRDKVLIYHDTGSPDTSDPSAWVEEAQKSLAHGFKSMKFDLNRFQGDRWNPAVSYDDMKAWVKILEAIREELGPDFPVGVDFHARLLPSDALKFIRMLDHLNMWYIEDPILGQNFEAYKRITIASTILILSGENLYATQDWRGLIENQACNIIHPDPQKVGGLLITKKLADWADIYLMSMACHNYCTPLGTIASGHACAAIRAFVALESDSVDLPHWQDIVLRDGPIFKDGYLELSDDPGLGVELNEEVCRAHLADGSGYFD